MKSQLKWLATATCAAVCSVYGYATEITVDNLAAVQGVTGNNGGRYDYFQFALNDNRMATSDGSTLADEVVVSKIAVGQRNPKNGNTYSIDEGSWLLIQEVNSLGGSNLGGTLGVTVAKTNPLTTEDKAPNVAVGTSTKTLTLCTWTLTTPVRLSKSKTYRATFYNASNAPAIQQLEMVTVSNVTTGTSTKIHASADPNYSPYVRVTVTDEVEPETGVAKRATLTEDGTWSSLPWDPMGTPEIADTVTLSADAARTVTLTDDVTISGLTLSGTGPFSFAPASGQTPMLIAYATTADVSTEVSATAHLGAVALASGKTLTVAPSVGYNSLTSGTASSGADNASKLVVNAKTTPLSVTSTDSRSAALQNFTGVVEFQGSGSTGATVEFGYANGGQAFKPRFIFNGGTHTMRYGCNDNLFSPGGTDEKPTISVEEATSLTFVFKDLSGWGGTTAGSADTPPPSVIRVGQNGRLTFDDNGTNTGYFRDRILLDSGAEVTNAHSDFYFYGGVGGVAQLAMKDDQGIATWNGGFNTAKSASKIEIGSNSTLRLNGAITGSQEITKAGAGTLSLTGTVSTSVRVSAGTLKLGASVPRGSITVAGGRLKMPLPSSAKTVTAEGNEGTLVLILTDAQVAQGDLPTQLSWTGDVSKVEVRNSNGALLPRTVSKDNESGVLVLSTRAALTKTWDPGSASWDAGLSGFALGDNVVFGSNDASEAITVPVKTTVGTMTVNGTYAFTLSPGGLTASTITVAGSGKATFTPQAVRYVRLQLDNANGGTGLNAVPGVSELILMKGGTAVTWPLGTTIKQVNLDGSEVGPTWAAGGNEKVNALIDGVWNGSGKGLTYTNPEDGSEDTYSGGDSVNVNNNKWWPHSKPKAYAVIKLGSAIDFDGYKLMTTDFRERSAQNWTLEVSADGETWFVADSRTNWSVPNTNSFYVYDDESGSTIFPVMAVSAPIVVESHGILGGSAKITGDVTFEMGSFLDATTEQPLEITGAVTATGTEDYPTGMVSVTVPNDAVVWPVLKTTTEGLAAKLVCPGYEFHYREGTYWAVRIAAKSLTAEVTVTSNLSNLTWTWKQNSDSKNVARADLLKLWDFGMDGVTAALNTTSPATVTLDCATVPALTLSGTAAVTLSAAEGVTPTIASLTVAADSTVAAALLNCVTGSTTVESGKTLTLSGSEVTLTKLPTGTGSVKIPAESSVTYENGANAYSGKTTVEGELTLACELKFVAGTGSEPTYPIDIAQGGKVKLATGGSTYRSFQGKGDLVVTGNATLGIPGAASVEGGFDVTGNVQVNSGATLTVTSWTSNAVLSGANFQVEGQVTQDIYGFSLTVAANKSLSGTGTINVPVVFADGSVIKAVANGAVTCSGTVTLPAETGTVTVQATEYGAAVLKKSGLDVAKFALPTEAGESNWMTKGLFTEKDGALILVAKPTFTPPDGTPAMSDETARVIAKLAAASGSYGVTSVAVAAGRNPAAVEVFNNVMTVNDDTATIAYDFGVADMTIKDLQLEGDTATRYVLLAAKVQNSAGSNTASFAEGTKLTVLNGEDEITPTSVSAAEAGAVAETGVQWLAVPLARLFSEGNSLGTRSLKVKASKASN